MAHPCPLLSVRKKPGLNESDSPDSARDLIYRE
jgi:hypothetical protein